MAPGAPSGHSYIASVCKRLQFLTPAQPKVHGFLVIRRNRRKELFNKGERGIPWLQPWGGSAAASVNTAPCSTAFQSLSGEAEAQSPRYGTQGQSCRRAVGQRTPGEHARHWRRARCGGRKALELQKPAKDWRVVAWAATPIHYLQGRSRWYHGHALVDEAYTSQTCPQRLNCTKPKGRLYRCPVCGFVGHRDGVGCANLLSQYYTGEYIAEPLSRLKPGGSGDGYCSTEKASARQLTCRGPLPSASWRRCRSTSGDSIPICRVSDRLLPIQLHTQPEPSMSEEPPKEPKRVHLPNPPTRSLMPCLRRASAARGRRLSTTSCVTRQDGSSAG